jgi:hypothetical protein
MAEQLCNGLPSVNGMFQAISANSVQAAPAMLVDTICAVAIAKEVCKTQHMTMTLDFIFRRM